MTVALACAASGACFSPAFRTMPGPESTTVASDLRGYVLVASLNAIQVFKLPSLAGTVLRRSRGYDADVHAIGGPDRRGRLGFVENHMTAEFHVVKTVRLDGSDEGAVVTREGDALWTFKGHGVGYSLAMSPDTGLLAAVVELRGIQMRNPDALLQEGTLMVWNVETAAPLPVTVKALEAPVSFFPDGRRIAYTGLIDRDEARRLLQEHGTAPEQFGKGLMSWPRLPAACVVDLDTGRVQAIHPGGSAIVSPDGTTLLVQGEGAALRAVDLARGRSRHAVLPGLVGLWYRHALIAFVDEDRVLYRALPTQGAKARWTTSNSPLVGPKPMLSVKVARLSTGEFQTVVPYLDPRQKVSFGVADKWR